MKNEIILKFFLSRNILNLFLFSLFQIKFLNLILWIFTIIQKRALVNMKNSYMKKIKKILKKYIKYNLIDKLQIF